MTEAEWLDCTDPDKMLWFPLLRNKISDRKLRLFACACCRRIGNLLTDDRSQAAIEVAELYADGLATLEDLCAARENAKHAVTSPVIIGGTPLGTTVHFSPGSVALSVAATEHFSPRGTAIFAAMFVEEVAGNTASYYRERQEQAGIFRDLIGNPFRHVTLDPAIFQWKDRTIPKLAEGIYDERTFDRLPILADALEDAGCTDADILAHCRGPGPHVRGCWVVDLLLGKN